MCPLTMITEGVEVLRPLQLLTTDETKEIHISALDVLQSIGVAFEDKMSLEVLQRSGCEVNFKTSVAKIPKALTEEMMKKAPSSVTLCGRKPECDLKVGGRHVYFAGGANAIKVVDPKTYEVRDATVKDMVDLTVISDALENVHCYLPIVWPQDVPAKGVDRVKAEVAFNNTVKHYFADADGYDGAMDQVEMAETVAGGEEDLRKRPILSLAPCITSPLCWGSKALEVLRVMATKGLPQIISSEPLSGATSPVTLAGSLVQQDAEILSGIVLSQLITLGTPVLGCTLPSIMDMRTANISSGAVELGLMCAAMAQVYQFYGLPYVGTGGIADSKVPDQQAAYEKSFSLLLSAQAGTNLIHLSTGMLEAILAISYEQMVIDNEILGMALRAIRGVEVTPERLALDTIRKVGPRGHFLAEKHTLRHLKQEHFITNFTDRNSRRTWEEKGMKDSIGRAKDIVDKILVMHEPERLDRDTQRVLEEIRKKAQTL